MLGTNDAKDAGDGGPPNWQHDCAAAGSLVECVFAQEYKVCALHTKGYSHDGPIGRRMCGYILMTDPSDAGCVGAQSEALGTEPDAPSRTDRYGH
eukprot:6869647-Pyramimonas_sp.AAC.1